MYKKTLSDFVTLKICQNFPCKIWIFFIYIIIQIFYSNDLESETVFNFERDFYLLQWLQFLKRTSQVYIQQNIQSCQYEFQNLTWSWEMPAFGLYLIISLSLI